MLVTRICGLPECDVEFQTDNKRKMHCCRAHSNLAQVRKWRKNHPKKGGGGGGGNGGGGGEPMLFDDGLVATIGGAVEYAGSGSVSDKNRYSVKSDAERKPVVSASRRASRKPSRGGHRAA